MLGWESGDGDFSGLRRYRRCRHGYGEGGGEGDEGDDEINVGGGRL